MQRINDEESTQIEIKYKLPYKLSPEEMNKVMTDIMDHVMDDFKGRSGKALPREIVVPMLKHCTSFNDMMCINYNGVTYKLSDDFPYNNQDRSSSTREKFLNTFNTSGD